MVLAAVAPDACTKLWWVNFQPDAPDTIWSPQLREDIKRLRTFSVHRQEPASALGHHAVPSGCFGAHPGEEDRHELLPRELRQALEHFFAAAVAVRIPEDSVDEAKLPPVPAARRMIAMRRSSVTPMVAHAHELSLALEADVALCNLLPPEALRQLSVVLQRGPTFISYPSFETATIDACSGSCKPPPSVAVQDEHESLRLVQRFVVRQFNGDCSAALQAAWKHKNANVQPSSSLKSSRQKEEDHAYEICDWMSFLEDLGWPASVASASRMVEASFSGADWRGLGHVPVSELLFAEISSCRKWLANLGTRQEVHALLDKSLLHRTQRQKKFGLVGANQWTIFLMHHNWPFGQSSANASFNAVDAKCSGEVTSHLLIGPL